VIVKMKKVTLLCTAEDRERSLESLRELGVLHLIHVRPPQGEDVTEARQRLEGAGAALAALRRVAGDQPRDPPPAGDDGRAVAAEVQGIVTRIKNHRDRLAALVVEAEAARPFGEATAEQVAALERAGLVIRFFRVSVARSPEIPDGVSAFVLAEDAARRWLALVGQERFDFAAPELALPERRSSEIEAERTSLTAEIEGLEARLVELTPTIPAVEAYQAALTDEIAYREARAGMAVEGPVAYLQGFCPEIQIARLEEAARRRGWGLVVDEPDSADPVPTLIRNPAWVRPIESLLAVLKVLPGYREVDVSVSFFGFMTIFFAMIIGDAGYGLVIFLAALLARMKARSAPPEPFRLLFVFSLATIAWGVLTGTYFAIEVTALPHPLRQVMVDWLASTPNIMTLCLLIGAIHLSVAHLWNAVRFLNTLQAIGQLGWFVTTWLMFFTARTMILGQPFPGWFKPVAAAGLAAVVLFMTPFKKLKDEWVNHVMLPLSLMSHFGDVLSYLRLFALAVAGVQLGSAFNSMTSFDGPAAIALAVVILALGHGLNVVLCLISVLVHGVRLNALEFSMHFGLEWAGSEYRPFARRASGANPAP
jgi:V/A-type H+-transporting ATPase subunit I